MFKKLINKNFRKPSGLIGCYIVKFLRRNQIEYDEMDSLLKRKHSANYVLIQI
jgi:hypothetical protein